MTNVLTEVEPFLPEADNQRLTEDVLVVGGLAIGNPQASELEATETTDGSQECKTKLSPLTEIVALCQDHPIVKAIVDSRPRRLSKGSKSSSDSVKRWLDEAGESDLLTREQEQEFAEWIQQGISTWLAVKGGEYPSRDEQTVRHIIALGFGLVRRPGKFSGDIGDIESPNPPAVMKILKAAAAQKIFVESNLRLVNAIAKRYPEEHLRLLDHVQNGNTGLMHAVELFDPTRGNKFSTYAINWIKQAIARGMETQNRSVRLPSGVEHTVSRIKKFTEQQVMINGIEPTETEILAHLNDLIKKDKAKQKDKGKSRQQNPLTIPKLREIMRFIKPLPSLDKTVDGSDDTELGDLLPVEDIALECMIGDLSNRDDVLKFEKQMQHYGIPKNRRQLLLLRYQIYTTNLNGPINKVKNNIKPVTYEEALRQAAVTTGGERRALSMVEIAKITGIDDREVGRLLLEANHAFALGRVADLCCVGAASHFEFEEYFSSKVAVSCQEIDFTIIEKLHDRFGLGKLKEAINYALVANQLINVKTTPKGKAKHCNYFYERFGLTVPVDRCTANTIEPITLPLTTTLRRVKAIDTLIFDYLANWTAA